MNVSEFIKENIPLCVCTFGLAIVGYMGYHAVRWIINKCQKTEKIDQVANKHLKSLDIPRAIPAGSEQSDYKFPAGIADIPIDPPKKFSKPPKSLVNRVSKSDITEGKVDTRQGEYIVFNNLFSGEKTNIAIEPETKPSTAVPTEQPSEMVFSAHLEKPSSEGEKQYPEKLEVEQESTKKSFVSSGEKSPTGIDEPSKTPKSLVNRVSNLDITEGKVNTGQGEYIVFHNLPSGEKKEVERETYEQVYKILNEYAPAAIVKRNSDMAMDECDNRYEIIKSNIKEIDPTLEVVFVPRTLYELIFIRKCIREDLKHNKICSQLSPGTYLNTITVENFEGDQQKFESFQEERLKTIAKEKKCWHLCYFDDVGDNDHPGVRDVAYRLNRVVAKTLSPTADGFTHEELSKHAKKEIKFLNTHYSQKNSVGNCNYPGPTTNFRGESTRNAIRPMGIRDDNHAQIIRDAIAIDCSKVARRSFFLYRGANFQKDAANCWSEKDKPHSLSFGSSLFAGSLYDGGATAFHYMRKGQNAYAIPVPFDRLNSSPFFIPPTNTVAQLFGNGEIFHGRTKSWKDYDLKKIGGFPDSAKDFKRDHLKSELSKDELLTQFQHYKNQAIQLK